MNEKKTKVLSFVAVLLMTGAILATVPFVSGVNGDEKGTIVVVIKDSNGPVPVGYEVDVYDTANDIISRHYLARNGYIEIGVSAGYYQVRLPAQEVGSNAYFPEKSDVFRVDPNATVDRSFTVSYASESYTLKGRVTDSNGGNVSGAMVSITDYLHDFGKETVTDSNGTYSMSIYNSTFGIRAYHAGMAINYSYGVIINSTTTINITLENKPYITGYVTDSTSKKGIMGTIHITLYDKERKKVVMKENDSSGPFFQVSAYPGNFSILISADGYNAYFNDSVYCSGSSVDMGQISLQKAVRTSINTAYTFNGDFNSLHMLKTVAYSPAHTITGLELASSGNLRYQIDHNPKFGNADGMVDANESKAFQNWLNNKTTSVSTYGELSANGTYFNETSSTVTVSGLEGNVTSETPINIATSANFTSYRNISEKNVSIFMEVVYDSSTVEYNYSIALPSGYERTHLSAPSDVDVSGFTTVIANPSAGTGTATVSFTAEKSLAGNASINVATGEYVYQRDNDTYIVKDGKNVSFGAEFTDPNGNENYANYSWDFNGDGTADAYGKSVVHAFSAGGEHSVVLTVKEADGEGNTTTANLTIQVDDTNPIPIINTDTTNVDENTAVEFNASASSDVVNGSIDGIILSYLWDFGDNTSSTQKVVDHSYEKWGTYTVKLTVTDVVGNSNNTTKEITVDDATKPVPKFNWTVGTNTTEDTGGTISLVEGDTVEFNANLSYDPDGYREKGVIDSYMLTLKEGNTTLSSSINRPLTYTFSTPGTYTLELNVTDHSRNYKEISRIVDVKYGPRPRLEVNNLTLSTNSPVEGENLYIIANISNFGDADSNSPRVTFYVNGDPLSGDVKFYEYENGSLVETSPTIPKGEYRIVKIAWTPAQETYTIKVNATDSEEPSGSSITHEKEIRVTAGPAAWKGMIPVIILVVVILAIVGLYYAYNKGIGPFGEGFRKSEKKEKGKKKEKK